MRDLIKGSLTYLLFLALIFGCFKLYQWQRKVVIETDDTSMSPDYPPGSYTMNSLSADIQNLELGRAIAFRTPTEPPKTVVGWVLAREGQTIAIKKGKVVVNDAPARRQPTKYQGHLAPMVVPRGCAYILTNEGGGDSTSYGAIPMRDILGVLE